jgi:hypothetical protein
LGLVAAMLNLLKKWLEQRRKNPLFFTLGLGLSVYAAINEVKMLVDLATYVWQLVEKATGLADLLLLPFQVFHDLSIVWRRAINWCIGWLVAPVVQQPLCVAFLALARGWYMARIVYEAKRASPPPHDQHDLVARDQALLGAWTSYQVTAHAITPGTRFAVLIVGALSALFIWDLAVYQRMTSENAASEIASFVMLFALTLLLALYAPALRNHAMKRFGRVRDALIEEIEEKDYVDPPHAAAQREHAMERVEQIRDAFVEEVEEKDHIDTLGGARSTKARAARPPTSQAYSVIVRCRRCPQKIRIDLARSGTPKCPNCGILLNI